MATHYMINYPKLEDLKLVALDLDGTVICPKGESPISERLLKSVSALQHRGLPVTFITGRTEDYALPIALRFDIELPLVTYNGARLYSVREQRIVSQDTIDSGEAAQLARWLETTDDVITCYLTRDEQLLVVQNRCSGRPQYDDYLFGTPRRLVPSIAQEIEKGGLVSKLIVITRRDVGKEMAHKFGPLAQAVRTHPELVELLPPGVSKGSGVKRLCSLLGVPLDAVLAIGDQENDIATFRVCGYSVAMGDAPRQVKEAAQFTTGTFAQDGCAAALERIFQA